ncbi:hypothetical protein [Dysgonomonas termitidis]|uniref:Uncharacterized protein n=1 Tax=Dysgonomonas termitidis TaxID=1516126 RepID=A0ABV9KXB1_9BACT
MDKDKKPGAGFETGGLIERISGSTLSSAWKNGKAGQFKDVEDNCCYRFLETDEHYMAYKEEAGQPHMLPVVICGFCAYLIKKWGKDTLAIYNGYMDMRLGEYRERHRNDADLPFRNLEEEFYFRHRIDEEELFRQSQGLFEYLSDNEAEIIRSYTDNYFRYIETKTPIRVKETQKQDRNNISHPPCFSRTFTATELEQLYTGLVKGEFISAGTSYSHFCSVFGGTPIPGDETPFSPLQWMGTVKELHYFISRHFPKEINQWLKAAQCFTKDNKPINKKSLSTAMDKYDNPPESSAVIDRLLS